MLEAKFFADPSWLFMCAVGYRGLLALGDVSMPKAEINRAEIA
jgi:hypothetical protein